MELEERVAELERKVAALEVPVQKRPLSKEEVSQYLERTRKIEKKLLNQWLSSQASSIKEQ